MTSRLDWAWPLQRFHILDQRSLLLVGELCPIDVAGVPIAGNGGIVRRAGAFGCWRIGDEPNLFFVVDIVSSAELLRPVLRALQQIPERWYRAIVEVRRARPNAV
jgi:hypothetical protein